MDWFLKVLKKSHHEVHVELKQMGKGVERNGSVGKYLPGNHVDLSSVPRTHTEKNKVK